jgi:hypothetical protein
MTGLILGYLVTLLSSGMLLVSFVIHIIISNIYRAERTFGIGYHSACTDNILIEESAG